MAGSDPSSGRRFLWNIVALVLIVLVGYNLYSGVTVQKIGIPGIFEVEYAGTATPEAPGDGPQAGPAETLEARGMTTGEALTDADRGAFEERQTELEQKLRMLEERLETEDLPPARPGLIVIAGSWQGQQGITYTFEQYGTRVVFSEINPFLGVTATGTGTLTGNSLSLAVTTAAFTTGTAALQVSPDGRQMMGTYVDQVTGVTVPLVLSR